MSDFCPVCKNTINENDTKCSICNFTDLHKEFITKEDAEVWFNTIILPYRNKWEEAKQKKLKKGEIIEFGKWYDYELRGIGCRPTPIEWLVIDIQGDKALLLSKYSIDGQDYNDKYLPVSSESYGVKVLLEGSEKNLKNHDDKYTINFVNKMVDAIKYLSTENSDTTDSLTWEHCTLRKWLNVNFYNNAFSVDEKRRILLTSLKNECNIEGCFRKDNPTQDNIFLLSYEEVNIYFKDDKSKAACATKVGEKKAVKSLASLTIRETDWWLRMPASFAIDLNGKLIDYTVVNRITRAIISGIGKTHERKHFYGTAGVRPAMWITI